MRSLGYVAPFALLLGAAAIAACSVSVTSTPTADGGIPTQPTDDGGSTIPVGGCATGGGTGAIEVTVTGLPAGLTADIKVTGNGGEANAITGTQSVNSNEDEYKVTAGLVMGPADAVVRTVYSATIDQADFCLAANSKSSVNVTYAPLPTSSKLWMTNNSTAQLLGYAEASLTATGSPAATTSVQAAAGKAIAFDNQGNMWTLGASVTDPEVQMFKASQFATSGAKTADVAITLDPGCAPGWTGMAFDKSGGLWLSSACGSKLVHLAAASLTTTNSPTPDVTITGTSLVAPEGIAFDANGNLWVADSTKETVSRYDAQVITSSTTTAPALILTPQTAAAVNLNANGLAFDKNGALWVTGFAGNTMYELPSPNLGNTGIQTTTPSTILTLPVDELLEGIAFDESGAAWLTLSAGKIGNLSASQLTSTASVTPNVILTSADIGNAASLAFYPGATGTPLYSSTLPATQ